MCVDTLWITIWGRCIDPVGSRCIFGASPAGAGSLINTFTAMTIHTKEISVLRYVIDKELTQLRERAYDMTDPMYQHTSKQIATLYKLYHALATVQYADDPNDAGLTFKKSSADD